MRVYRCWWCLGFINRGRDCGLKDCIKTRRSGPWKKRKRRNSVNHKPQPIHYTQ